MPNTTPLGIGDVSYPNHIVVKTKIIKNALAITKGNIYTPDSSGRLIVPVSTSGVADLTNGLFQAMDDAPAPTAEDTDSVQCLSAKSRIIMKANSGLVVGSEVELKSSGSTTTADTVMVAVQPKTKGYIGRIVEIYTESGGAQKTVTGSNDLVIVETGAA